MSTVLNPAKRQRAIGQGGDVYSQQISNDTIPGPEPRYYTTYLSGNGEDDQGAHGEFALFQEMRTTNLIPRTSAYQIAVEKASIDTKALPSFIATVDTSSANPSGDVNQLTSLVGFELNWSGSMFPSTLNGSTIAANPTTVGSTTPTYYSFFSTGGSSLPIKYSRSSAGIGNFTLTAIPPAVEGILQAYIENNPNSTYWLGQYNFNLDIATFLASFNKALIRAFGMWQSIAPTPHVWLVSPTEVTPGTWSFAGRYTAAQISGLDFSQVLLQSSINYSQAAYDDLHQITVDFYPVQALTYISGVNYITLPCNKKQSTFFTKYKALFGTPPAFSASLYANNNTIGSVPVASVSGGTSTQTLPSSTQIAIAQPSNVTNADNMATLTFSVSTLPSGNAAAMSVPCFDFYQGISSTKIQCEDVTVTLPNQEMGPLYVSVQPTRTDFLTTAYLLGFQPDTVFNLVQTSQTVYANRPLAPAFSTRIDIASYQPLIWRPCDAYVESSNPAPGSAYYYGYGTSYYLSNVVNPGIADCFQNEYDAYFTGDLPSTVMEKLLLKPNINAITDLSLTAQLYCTTYFNSATAPVEAIAAIQPWKAGDQYVAGTPVTFANTDPDSPINNLYIANTLTGTKDFYPPVPFQNSDYWLYCGPFIYSSAVPGATYMDGELVTYVGYANRFTTPTTRTPAVFTGLFGTPMTLVPRTGVVQTVATGGYVKTDGTYVYHEFLTNGSFTVLTGSPLNVKVMAIGGGGGGGATRLGGGGGGGESKVVDVSVIGSELVYVGAKGSGGKYAQVQATGGTVSTLGDYTYHTFTHTDSFYIQSGPSNLNAQVLIIGGGGGGGGSGVGSTDNDRGPGAGGGASAGAFYDDQTFSLGEGYAVTIGEGGQGGYAMLPNPRGKNGGNSSCETAGAMLISEGGGGGGFYLNPVGSAGSAGGFGGGGGASVTPGQTGGAGGVSNSDGGHGGSGNGFNGGGGAGKGGNGPNAGADRVGANGAPPGSATMNAGTNGETTIPYGGGGAGGGEPGGTGGTYTAPDGSTLELGGRGGNPSDDGGGGRIYSGSGGGGAGCYFAGENITRGGDGGSGVVIISYLTNYIVNVDGENGGASRFKTVTAIGGGGGGGNGNIGQDGASGGGGNAEGTSAAGGTGTNPGFNGGAGNVGSTAGGGGGFGGQAFDGNAASPNAGRGGLGVYVTLYNRHFDTIGSGGGGGSTALGGLPGGTGAGQGGSGYHSGQDAYLYGTQAGWDFNSGYGSGGGGAGANGNAEDISEGGNGNPGLVVIAYPLADYTYFGQYNLLKPTPVIGTVPPAMTLNVNPGDAGDVFELQLDTYGFGTYDSKKPRDPIHAYARDSWGSLQSNATSFVTNRVYDEFLLFECNTAFRDMFRGFSATAERYVNQLNGNSSTYWIHDFILNPAAVALPDMPKAWYDAQVQNDGISQASLRYMPPRMVSNSTASTTSPAYLRNTDDQVYYWTVTSSETARYSLWDPVQSIIIEGTTVPVSVDNLPVSEPVITQIQRLGGDSRLLLAEFFPKRNPGEGTIYYEPNFPRQIYLASGTELKQFSYKLSWRNKFTGEIIPLVLSSNGSAVVVFMFTPK